MGLPQNSPIRSARSKSGSNRTWSSSARGAGPRATSRSRVGAPLRRSARPGGHQPGPVYAVGALWADQDGEGSRMKAASRALAQAAAEAGPYPHDDDFNADRPAECDLVHCVDAHGCRLCPRDLGRALHRSLHPAHHGGGHHRSRYPRESRVGLPGLISGLSLPLFYVAFLNRSGPGTVCTSTATSQSCVDEWSPWPWLAIGIVLLVSGCVWFAMSNRRRGVAAP